MVKRRVNGGLAKDDQVLFPSSLTIALTSVERGLVGRLVRAELDHREEEVRSRDGELELLVEPVRVGAYVDHRHRSAAL